MSYYGVCDFCGEVGYQGRGGKPVMCSCYFSGDDMHEEMS